MAADVINLAQKLSQFPEHWSPRVVAVPRGVEHITRAAVECHALIIEPRGVVNSGDAGGALTARNDVWA
jgi:hypothetical protein